MSSSPRIFEALHNIDAKHRLDGWATARPCGTRSNQQAQHRCHHGRRHRHVEYRGLSPRYDAGRTPHIDEIAKEGMLFTDYYAEASCTAGRANFITGEPPIRTGMTTVGALAR